MQPLEPLTLHVLPLAVWHQLFAGSDPTEGEAFTALSAVKSTQTYTTHSAPFPPEKFIINYSYSLFGIAIMK